jgi:hypothetical protein
MGKPVIALVVATLTCGSASAYLWHELRDERAQTQRLEARVVELEKAAQAGPVAVEQLSSGTVEPAPAPEPTAESKPTPSRNASVAMIAPATSATFALAGPNARNGRMDPEMRRRMQESFEQQRAMLKDPEYRELMRSQQKIGMKRMYGDMEVMLGLTKEEADRVVDVLAEQQLRAMEQRPVMMPMEGSQPDQAAIREQQRVFEENRRKNEAELAAVLGPKYSEWQEYQQSMWSRSQVMRLRETLSGTDEPLRQDQIKPLVQAMAREQQQMQTNTARAQYPNGFSTPDAQMRMQEEWLERTAQSHERIRNSVSSLLTPAQLQQLQDQQDQERKMQEISMRMQRARAAEAQARGEDPMAPMVEAQLGVATGPMIAR